MTEQELFKQIIPEAIKRGIISPKTRFRKKSGFWYHKWINRILNLVYKKSNKNRYLNDYWTTIGYDIGGPDCEANEKGEFHQWYVLAHELKHVMQAMRRTRLIFGFLYLWTLSQGLLLLLCSWLPIFWSSGWVLYLWIAGWILVAGIHFIPQLPAPFRTKYELEAYAISMYFYLERFGTISTEYIDHLVENFTSMMYYMMEPDKEKIKKKIKRIATEIRMNRHPVKDDPIVKLVMDLKGDNFKYHS